MQIKEIFNEKKAVISLEIFPPKKDTPISSIYDTIDVLADLSPDFISVTYGAAGSTRSNTVDIASIIKNKYSIEALAHLTCVTSTKAQIGFIIEELMEHNIENILALRGDFPDDPNFEFPHPLHFEYASDLVEHIKKNYQDRFCIVGAAYPEGHIEASSITSDLLNLKRKVQVGTDFLISQLFFDNNLFYNFQQRALKLGIDTPIVAGIMPVIKKKQIEHIVGICGASISKKFQKILDRYGDKPEALKDAGISYATEQIIDLLSSGVKGIHIYTMNRPEIAKAILKNIESILKVVR